MIMSLKQKKIKFTPRIKLNHNMYKPVILFLMPSLLNTVGKIICYDFEMHGEQEGIKGVHKKVLLVKIRGKGCVVVQFYPWFKFCFFCFKLIIIHYHTQKQKKIKFNHNIYSWPSVKAKLPSILTEITCKRQECFPLPL